MAEARDESVAVGLARVRAAAETVRAAVETVMRELACLEAFAGRESAELAASDAGETGEDLITLKAAEGEFGIANVTARRWATSLGLGEKRGGRWYLSRRRTEAYRSAVR